MMKRHCYVTLVDYYIHLRNFHNTHLVVVLVECMKLNLKNKVYLKSMVMPIVTHIVSLHALPTDSPKEGAVILTSATQHMKGKYICS